MYDDLEKLLQDPNAHNEIARRLGQFEPTFPEDEFEKPLPRIGGWRQLWALLCGRRKT
jgi:hypothetical protein